MALTVLSVACGDPVVPPMPDLTYRYIVSVADIPEVTTDDMAVGFNLDDLVSDGSGTECTDDTDYTSPFSGEVGVDNQLAAYVIGLLGGMLGPDGVRGAIIEQIAAGTFLLVMDVTTSNLTADSSVSVNLFLANAPGPMCDNAAMVCPANSLCPADAAAGALLPCGPVTDATSGLIVPGQAFTQMTNVATVTGAIAGGRLSIAVASLPLTLVVSGSTIALNLRSARIAGDINATSISNGEIGAQLQIADIITLAAELGLAIDEATVRGVAHPDLDIDGAGVCQAISAGLSFESVLAAPPAS